MQIVIHEMRQHQVAGSNIQVPLESTVKELVVRVDIDSAERERDTDSAGTCYDCYDIYFAAY